MDPRESRKYIMANPPVDPTEMERRPSLIGRFFRRSSSISLDDGSGMQLQMKTTQTVTTEGGRPRRDSITDIVQEQMVNKPMAQTPPQTSYMQTHSEFSIFT